MVAKGKFLAGAAVFVLAATAHSSALDRRGGADDRPAQNIERDLRAQTRARLRDELGSFGPVFQRGREVRSFDGSNNNLNAPLAGASFQPMRRLGDADYADGIGAMAGPLRKSARAVSNHMSDQSGSLPNSYGTSDYLWQWGQFIDHDLDLGDAIASNDRSFDIPVPSGDPYFDPAGLGDRTIRFDRAIIDPASGTDLSNLRAPVNEISSWIDGSMVYGSDLERAEALRTHDGTGRLRTSRGDLLPPNTDLLPNANGPTPDPSRLFLAGDVRANEQLGLAVMHTLFVREHNRWAKRIRRGRPYYSGDDIYHAARRMVIAQIQIITYEEFLPALIGKNAIAPYSGYQPGDATISVEFAGGAYRLGHTLINKHLLRLDRRGRPVRDGHVALRNAFFNAPQILKRRNDLDPILRGLAAQKSQRYDPMIVDDLRNFLFGAPGAGGFDLASLNIQRGRDLGVPSYNDMREAMGLGRVSDFDDITSDPARQDALYKAYGSVDDIDLWVGGLSEDPVAADGSQLGPLFRKIVAEEFQGLRDHDRFWYKRDLSTAELRLVKDVRLSDIIHANTNVRRGEIPRNVFYVQH
ncbi:MAG: peroxidase family protein [Pseudomonadota bacterium]